MSFFPCFAIVNSCSYGVVYDGGKLVSGRKRHVAVDMMGLLLGVAETAASADDGNSASEVL
jgi:hypothetical protein